MNLQNIPLIGELSALFASFFWASASLLFLFLGRSIGPSHLNLFKGIIALLFLIPTAYFMEGGLLPKSFNNSAVLFLGFSGILGLAIGDTFYFKSLNILSPRKTLLITSFTPGVTAILAWLFLSEVIGVIQVFGMVLTVFGVLWVALLREADGQEKEGQKELLKKGFFFSMVSVFCQAGSNILVKGFGEGLGTIFITNLRLISGCLGLVIYLIFSGQGIFKRSFFDNKKIIICIFVAPFFGTFLGLWLSTVALIYTPSAGIASTLSSTSPLFILPLAAIFLKEKITLKMILGAIIAVAGIALLVI